jgi:hypothetical protein
MKVGKLTDGQSVGHYKSNDSRSRMFAHSAASYWNIASQLNDRSREDFDLWSFMHVGVPIMHMAIELIVKAVIAISDKKFIPERELHNTPKIISEHAMIPVLGAINGNKEKMELIGQLRKAWIDLRYAEGTLSYESRDKEIFDEMMLSLTEEFKKVSGLKTL